MKAGDYLAENVTIDPEALAYWFLRLNGFMTIVNFVVHPDRGREQRTDVDILGCRFPFRKELLENPMIDYMEFTRVNDKPLIVIAEVKKGRCKLNGPWTRPENQNMQRVLYALGVFPEGQLLNIASDLYKNGCYDDPTALITLLCMGSMSNHDLERTYPKVPQITWESVLSFIYNRFDAYRNQKSAHPQWDECGKKLWEMAIECRNQNEFVSRIQIDID